MITENGSVAAIPPQGEKNKQGGGKKKLKFDNLQVYIFRVLK